METTLTAGITAYVTNDINTDAMKYKITQTRLHIIDACSISKKDFQKTLNQIKAIHGKSLVFRRSDLSLKREWAFHNFRRRRDCDLDFPCAGKEWLYKVAGWLVWPFIK